MFPRHFSGPSDALGAVASRGTVIKSAARARSGSRAITLCSLDDVYDTIEQLIDTVGKQTTCCFRKGLLYTIVIWIC